MLAGNQPEPRRHIPTPLELPAIASISRVTSAILDDWGPEPLTAEQRRDLLEIVEDRYQTGSLLITSQLPLDRWHDRIGCPTLADAILDRLAHNAIRLDLHGGSLRKRRSPAGPGPPMDPGDDLPTTDAGTLTPPPRHATRPETRG